MISALLLSHQETVEGLHCSAKVAWISGSKIIVILFTINMTSYMKLYVTIYQGAKKVSFTTCQTGSMYQCHFN